MHAGRLPPECYDPKTSPIGRGDFSQSHGSLSKVGSTSCRIHDSGSGSPSLTTDLGRKPTANSCPIPECWKDTGKRRLRVAAAALRTMPSSTAASSTGIVEVVDSSEAVVEPDYRVMGANGTWVAATEEQAAEFRAHDREIQRENRLQEQADRMAYEEFQAGMAQQWDDWALSSEMARALPEPSRKRVRVTIAVGTASGQELGEAVIEGVIENNQTATVSFSVAETMLGGLGANATVPPRGPSQLSAQAAPQLADFDRNHLPGLAEHVVVFMLSVEGRHWLWQYQVGAVSMAMIEARFGCEIAEAFQLWVALQEDLDKTVRNVGAEPLQIEQQHNTTSEAGTEKMDTGKPEGQKVEMGRELEEDKYDEVDRHPNELGATQLDGMDTFVGGPCIEGEDREPGGDEEEAERPDEGDDSGLAEHRPEGHVRDLHVAEELADEEAGRDENGEGGGALVEESEVNGVEPVERVVPGNVWSEDPNDLYYVPVAWRRVLAAWNRDAAPSTGFEDTAISVGNFEHPEGELGMAEDAPAASTATGSGAPSASTGSGTTERSERVSGSGAGSSKGGQTDLRSWLQK